MYLSNLKLTNFRQFGDADQALSVTFQPGITALVGRNDSGKTAVIDAIRYALLTRDQQFFRVQPDDFHVSADGSHASSFSIVCQLSDLSLDERAAFAEHLSFEDGSAFKRSRGEGTNPRRYVTAEHIRVFTFLRSDFSYLDRERLGEKPWRKAEAACPTVVRCDDPAYSYYWCCSSSGGVGAGR